VYLRRRFSPLRDIVQDLEWNFQSCCHPSLLCVTVGPIITGQRDEQTLFSVLQSHKSSDLSSHYPLLPLSWKKRNITSLSSKMSNFDENDDLTFIPNNFHVWVKKLISHSVPGSGNSIRSIKDVFNDLIRFRGTGSKSRNSEQEIRSSLSRQIHNLCSARSEVRGSSNLFPSPPLKGRSF
jgi:hypothetical protein